MAKPLSIGFDVPFDEAISQAQSRGVVLPEVYYGQLQGIARQKAFSIAGLTSLDQILAVKNSLSEAARRGQSFQSWKKEVEASGVLSLPKHRMDNIYRTNLQGSYSAGKWEKALKTAKSRPYLMYDAINDSRVRPAHLALDNVIRPINSSFWKTHLPPNGYRCRCGFITLTKEQAEARSGKGKGLNNPALLDDGEKAMPDQGWEYNPSDRLDGVNSAIDERTKEAPKLVKQVKQRIKQRDRLEEAKSYVIENGKPLEAGSIEFAFVYDETGGIVLRKKGGKSHVSFEPDEIESMKAAKGITMVHNHPSSRSLSGEDFKFIGNFEGGQIVAIGHNGAEYYGKALKTAEFSAAEARADAIIRPEFMRLINAASGNDDLQDAVIAMAEAHHHHILNTLISMMGVIEYKVKNLPDMPAEAAAIFEKVKKIINQSL
jgi:SPP1 gp7 family putative phage head morphogenesis protein